MADKITASGTGNPYIGHSYTVEANDKNTITMNSYFKLLAAQLQNQDMTNPMDNSEMMAQMTQMAMVQSMSAMTESISTSTAVSTQTYAAGLVGQRVTVAVTKTNAYGQDKGVDVKYGDVESVNFVGGTPVFRLKGDDKDYPLSYLLGMGEIPNPYDKKDGNEEGDKEEACVYLDAVVAARGMTKFKDREGKLEISLDDIMDERRKELFGEGQWWFCLKRLNQDVYVHALGATLKGSDKIYTLPLPSEELDPR